MPEDTEPVEQNQEGQEQEAKPEVGGSSEDQNLAENAELVKRFAAEAGVDFNRFKSQRDDIQDLMVVMDYMYACAQNRTIAASERGVGANLNKDPRANLASTIFHRQVNTLAGRLVAVAKSKPDICKFVTVRNPEKYASGLDAKARCAAAAVAFRWGLKQMNFYEKLPEFATHIYKYSNPYVMVQQHQKFKRVEVRTPIYEQVGTTVAEDGTEIPDVQIVGENVTYETKITENWPEFVFPHVDKVYCDLFLPDIESGNCVVFVSLRNKSEIQSDVRSGYFSEKQYKLLTNSYKWDGSIGAELIKKEFENRNKTFDASQSGMFLQFDILRRCPIDGKVWKEDADELIYWGTFIGNDPSTALCMRLERNPDPDDEFPIKAIHVLPDKSDTIQHTTIAEVVRSAYSTLCTLMGVAVDNGVIVNDPPMTVLDGAHRIEDFTFKKGQRWHVDRHDALQQFPVRDVTQTTQQLIGLVETEIMRALATDPSYMGEYAGSRTSATEFLEVNKNSSVPLTMQVDYVLNQLVPFMARKFMSYAEKYMTPDQMLSITDRNKEYSVKVGDVVGEYDIVVDLVQDYISDMVTEQKLSGLMQTVASTPFFQSSPTHTLDAGKLLKQAFERAHMNPDEFILPPSGVDAEEVAYYETDAMLAGMAVKPMQGQNHSAHLKVHEAELIRWRGLDDTNDPRATNANTLLAQHIAETKMMQMQGASPQAPSAPVGPQNETQGEVVGNQMAGTLGGMM